MVDLVEEENDEGGGWWSKLKKEAVVLLLEERGGLSGARCWPWGVTEGGQRWVRVVVHLVEREGGGIVRGEIEE